MIRSARVILGARPMTHRTHGFALVLALCLLLVVGAMGGVMLVLSRSSSREVDVLAGYLGAVSVGEQAYAELTARLASRPWTERWFRSRSDAQLQVEVAHGNYDYLIRDALVLVNLDESLNLPALSSSKQVDLLVRARHHDSEVGLYWRLIYPDECLEPLRKLVPLVFQVLPDSSRSASIDPIVAMVMPRVQRRATNDALVRPLVARLASAPDPPTIQRILGMPGVPPIVDVLSVPGGTPRPAAPYSLGLPVQPGAPPIPGPLTGPPVMVGSQPPATTPGQTSDELAALQARIERIQCASGSLQGPASLVFLGFRASMWLWSADAGTSRSGFDGTPSQALLLDEGRQLVAEAQAAIGFDPVQIACPSGTAPPATGFQLLPSNNPPIVPAPNPGAFPPAR